MQRPRISLSHHGPAELIVEYLFAGGQRGLVAFKYEEGAPTVRLYCHDPAIQIRVTDSEAEADQVTEARG